MEIKPSYYETARKIMNLLLPYLQLKSTQPFCISISGESGSGKSVTAFCLAQLLEQEGIKVAILNQDDYFKLPPETNRLQRAKDLAWVGMNEVEMDLIQKHIDDFKRGVKTIVKPFVIFNENTIEETMLSLENVSILIVEGTYTSYLSVDYQIFMTSNYQQTRQKRIERARDVFDDNLDKILEIEHQIIAPSKQNANIVIDENYHVSINTDN